MAKDTDNNDFFSLMSHESDEEQKVEDTAEEDDEDEQVEDDSADNSDTPDDTKDEDGESDEVDDDTDFYTTIINEGAESGIFFFDEDKEYEGTGEEIFWEVQTDTLNKRWREEYEDPIPEEYKSLFTALKNGVSVTEWYENTQPVDYSKVDIDDEDTQKQLIKDHLEATGLDEEDVADTLQDYEDSGTLEKNAKKALKYLEKAEKGKAAEYERQLSEYQEQVEARQEEDFRRFKSEVYATEELGGLKLSKSEREKLFDHITKPINKKGESQLVVNQKSQEAQLLLAYMDMKGFKFSDLEKKAESKAASGLRAKLSKTTDINAKSGGSRKQVSTSTNKIPDGFPWG